MNILFVCTGNISRSFLAEMMLKNELKQHYLNNISVSSAGTLAFAGMQADEEMIGYLSGLGIPVEGFSSRPLTREGVEWADLILVMEKDHLDNITEQWPFTKNKIELLAGYVAADQINDDIVDPFGRSPYYYRIAQSQIMLAVKSLVKKLLADNTYLPNA